MSDRALYYPYMHIRNVNWLKGTLLMFKQVCRMTPQGDLPSDAWEIKEFLQTPEPLLYSANLSLPRVVHAQARLATQLEKDVTEMEFCQRFGEAAARELRGSDLGFLIHKEKLQSSLVEVLHRSKLAWRPEKNEVYAHLYDDNYIEVHPNIGEAVMATLAIACAIGEGLDIVGDERSGQLHACLATKKLEDVYNAWLHPAPAMQSPPAANAQELFEYVITFACDVSSLKVKALVEMAEDREPIQRLMRKLTEHAAKIPAMDHGKYRTAELRAVVHDILEEWEADRKNMSTFWKNFFTTGLVDQSGKTFEKVAAKALEVLTPSATVAGAGVVLAPMPSSIFLGAGVGLGIGLIAHGTKAVIDSVTQMRASPYRYLTTLEDAGVVFRTDLSESVEYTAPSPSSVPVS